MSLISKEDGIFEGDIDLFEYLRNRINDRLGGVLSDHRFTAEKPPYKEQEIARIKISTKKFTGRNIEVKLEREGD